jgi:hypothetical protein
MPELPEQLSASSPPLALLARIRTAPGIVSLVAEAEATWRARASAAGTSDSDEAAPGWRAFEDAFPTFYEFTNRPR